MDYQNFNTDDFISDEDFIRWVKQPNERNKAFWKRWLATHPEKEKEVDRARRFIQSMDYGSQSMSPQKADALLQKINQGISRGSTRKTTAKKRGLGVSWRAVAATLLVGVVALGGYLLSTKGSNVYATKFEETRQLVLPDGSMVVLNASSKLKSKKNWEQDEVREVWLEGEAYFSVTETPLVGNRQFIVHAGDIEVEVLGTTFNVNNRKEEVSIVLTSGKVQLKQADKKEKEKSIAIATMMPGERVTFQSKENNPSQTKVNTSIYTSWTDKRIILEETPLSHLLPIFKNYYGYEVVLKDETIMQRKVTTTIPIEELDVLLTSIATSFDIPVQKAGKNQIVIGQ